MLEIKNIDFYYFSGTGNTFLVVKQMCDVFTEKGINVNLYKIEKSNPRNINLDHIIGLAFPVACFTTYPLVWDFIKLFPKANGTKVFMVDTLAGISFAVVGPLKRVLKNKGYLTIGAKEIKMPCNFLMVESDNKNNKRIRKGLEKAKEYAIEIIEGRSEWSRVPILSDINYLFFANKFTWKTNQKLFKIEAQNAKCTRCGLCVKLCPVNNIDIIEYPIHKDKCQTCMRCISFCPSTAIYLNKKESKRYRAVEVKELI